MALSEEAKAKISATRQKLKHQRAQAIVAVPGYWISRVDTDNIGLMKDGEDDALGYFPPTLNGLCVAIDTMLGMKHVRPAPNISSLAAGIREDLKSVKEQVMKLGGL